MDPHPPPPPATETIGIPTSSTNQPPPETASIGIPVSSANQFYPSTNPLILQFQSHPPIPWSTGLCDCFDDVGNCCITFLCPCITFGQIAEIVDKGSTSCCASGCLYGLIMCLTGCQWVYSCFYRSKMRGSYFLEEGPCVDCCVHCCCESCALCQEYRELKIRGYDLHSGWQANVEKRSAMFPPTVVGGMSR